MDRVDVLADRDLFGSHEPGCENELSFDRHHAVYVQFENGHISSK